MHQHDEELEWHPLEESSALGIYFLQDHKPAKVKVNGMVLCAVRKGQDLFFVRNACPHSGGPLSQGWVNEQGQLVCPLHRFRFELDGPQPGPEGYPLHLFPWRLTRGTVEVGFKKQKRLWGIF